MSHERYCWEGNGFGFNHKIMIKVQESLLSIMETYGLQESG